LGNLGESIFVCVRLKTLVPELLNKSMKPFHLARCADKGTDCGRPSRRRQQLFDIGLSWDQEINLPSASAPEVTGAIPGEPGQDARFGKNSATIRSLSASSIGGIVIKPLHLL